MPLPRFQRLDEDKREALLRAAAEEFGKEGFDGASLNKILAAAGLGKSSFYYYFEHKEDLFATCAVAALNRLMQEAPPFPLEVLTAENCWQTMERYFQELVVTTSQHPLELALFRLIPSHRRELMPRFEELSRTLVSPIVKAIRRGQELGVVRTDLDAQTLFTVGMAADNALDDTLLRTTEPLEKSLPAHATVVLDLWRRILEARPAAATRTDRG